MPLPKSLLLALPIAGGWIATMYTLGGASFVGFQLLPAAINMLRMNALYQVQ